MRVRIGGRESGEREADGEGERDGEKERIGRQIRGKEDGSSGIFTFLEPDTHSLTHTQRAKP